MASVGTIPTEPFHPGAVLADKSNMDSPEVEELLSPPTSRAK